MARQIAMRNRTKKIVGYAIVDDVDYEEAIKHSWCLMRNGYPASRFGGRLRYLHRWLLHDPSLQVDHKNRNKCDCRRDNMRLVTDAQNKQNVPGRNASSQHRGVQWNKQANKWMACYAGKGMRHRKTFETEEAAAAYISSWRQANLPFAMEA